MPALVAGIHVFLSSCLKDSDGRDKPGHDEVARWNLAYYFFFAPTRLMLLMARVGRPDFSAISRSCSMM
jgi:hypothetical protein